MSLLGDRLGTAIWTTIKGLNTYSPPMSPAEDAKGLALWKAISNDIVTEFTANGVVTPDSLTSPSGPVTGTGKIT